MLSADTIDGLENRPNNIYATPQESKTNHGELLARNARFDVHLEGPFWNSLGSIFGPHIS
jgi:hypothetical protein